MNYVFTNIKKIFVFIIFAGATFSIGCASIPYNKEYAGERFPREFDVAFIGVNINLIDGSSSEPVTKEEEKASREMISKKLSENQFGFNAVMSTNELFRDTNNVENQNAVNKLIFDCNVETGIPAKEVIESPIIQKAVKPGKRYSLFINYSGSSQSARTKTGKIALFLLTPVAANADDSSFFSAVIYDKVANKYVFKTMSYVSGLTDDPRDESVIDSHVKELFESMKAAKEAKQENK